MSPEPDDPTVKWLVDESQKILHNWEELYDLAGKRLAFRSMELEKHLRDPANTFKLAVIGYPNSGKTTLSYTVHKIFEMYQVPSFYCDLDLYSQAGKAISGQISWSERVKRSNVAEKEIQESLELFQNAKPGIVIADFPGRIDNPYHRERLKIADEALILSRSEGDMRDWAKLCNECSIGYRFLISKLTTSLEPPIYPQAVKLERKIALSPATLTLATSVLEEAAQRTEAPPSIHTHFFSEPERLVLEEMLDFLYSIQNP